MHARRHGCRRCLPTYDRRVLRRPGPRAPGCRRKSGRAPRAGQLRAWGFGTFAPLPPAEAVPPIAPWYGQPAAGGCPRPPRAVSLHEPPAQPDEDAPPTPPAREPADPTEEPAYTAEETQEWILTAPFDDNFRSDVDSDVMSRNCPQSVINSGDMSLRFLTNIDFK